MLSLKVREVRPTQIATFLAYKTKLRCAIFNDCHTESGEFKQVKTTWRPPPRTTASWNTWSGSATAANSEKILLDLAASQLKWQLCYLAPKKVIFRHH